MPVLCRLSVKFSNGSRLTHALDSTVGFFKNFPLFLKSVSVILFNRHIDALIFAD